MINTYQYFSERFKCTVEISYKSGLLHKVTADNPDLNTEVIGKEALCKFPMIEAYFIASMAGNDSLAIIQENVTFDIAYKLYGYTRGSKIKAARAWENLPKRDQLKLYHFIPTYKQEKKQSGEFLQHFTSYINSRVWDK